MKLLYNAESGPQAAHVTPCFVENYDVLVVGAGTAGAIAAIRAARGGLRVCAVDRLTLDVYTRQVFWLLSQASACANAGCAMPSR